MAASNKPQAIALTVYQGEPFELQLTFDDGAGAVLDLTGYSARMQARDAVYATETRLDWSSDDGQLVLGGTDGTLRFAVSEAAVNALADDNTTHAWVYDLFLVSPAGHARKALEGRLTLVPRVTRA